MRSSTSRAACSTRSRRSARSSTRTASPASRATTRTTRPTQARVRGGYYWTGDLGYRDEQGYFYFAGRDFEWLRVDGENFAAAPIERLVARHPDVVLVCVYAVPDEEVGDQVMVTIELRPGATFDPEDFDEFLSEQPDLGTKWSPRYVRVVDKMPTTESQKPMKRQLRHERWDAAGGVYWRPAKNEPLRPMDDTDREELTEPVRGAGPPHGPRRLVSEHRGAGGKAALVAPTGTRTFAELADRSTRLARVLRDHGVGPGDRVALMLPNSCEWFETNVAVARLGAQLVPVNWHLRRDELAWILEDSDARVLVTGTELATEAEAAVAALPGCHVLRVGDDYEAAIAAAQPDPEAAAAAGIAPGVVLYTSGTTGRPKGVVHEQATTARSRQTHVDLWGFTRDDVHLLVGPAYHGAPWSYAVTHLALGATVVVMPRWDAREFLRLVERTASRTRSSCPPTSHGCSRSRNPSGRSDDLSSLRLVLHGAAACPIAVKERIVDFFAPAEVWEFYGFSEAGRVSRIGPDEWRAHPGSAGRPFEGVHVAILDDAGTELLAGETGWIHVVPGHGDRFHYRNNPDATAAVTAPTRFGPAVTGGDVGHLDADGYLYVTDRSAELVVRGGVNVYPREAEDALHTHPAVVDCAAFGVPDAVYGERLVALVELTPGADVDAGTRWAHVRNRLAAYKCPEEIRIVDTLPRDPNGKVRKTLLREQARAGSEGPAVKRNVTTRRSGSARTMVAGRVRRRRRPRVPGADPPPRRPPPPGRAARPRHRVR